MKKVAIIAGFAGLLLFSGQAWAEESDGHGHSEFDTPAQVQTQVKQEPDATHTDEHADMTADEHANMTSQDSAVSTHEEEAGDGGHGSHDNVVETPPNIPVLSAFAAVNAAFILYGAWKKWFGKKEVLA